MNYSEIMDRATNMPRHADGNGSPDGHLTMNRREWPTGVALNGIYRGALLFLLFKSYAARW